MSHNKDNLVHYLVYPCIYLEFTDRSWLISDIDYSQKCLNLCI